jgi:hypothetical protein
VGKRFVAFLTLSTPSKHFKSYPSSTNSNRVVKVVMLSVYSVAFRFEFMGDFVSTGYHHYDEWIIDFIRLIASAWSKALTIRERLAH